MEELFEYLARYSPLSEGSKRAIAKISQELHIRKNSDLQPIGHTCKTIYFLKKGIARIYYFKDDVDITESFSFEGHIVVRYESLFTGKPSKKGIQMLEDSDVIAINASGLFKLYDRHRDIERLFRNIFEAALIDQVNRIESLQFHTADERYKALIKDAPDIIKRAPLKYIASYLGITPVSLSRIRSLR